MTEDFRSKNLVFIDVETTGLSPLRHEIIEVACLVADGRSFELVKSFDAKVKPEHIETAEQAALKINGYNKSAWEDALTQNDALMKVANIAPSGVLVGWNVAFDWSFLDEAFEKRGIIHKFDHHKIDAMSVAYAKLFKKGNFSSLGLRRVAPLLGIKLDEVHTAKEDVQATYEIFKKLMGKEMTQGGLGI